MERNIYIKDSKLFDYHDIKLSYSFNYSCIVINFSRIISANRIERTAFQRYYSTGRNRNGRAIRRSEYSNVELKVCYPERGEAIEIKFSRCRPRKFPWTNEARIRFAVSPFKRNSFPRVTRSFEGEASWILRGESCPPLGLVATRVLPTFVKRAQFVSAPPKPVKSSCCWLNRSFDCPWNRSICHRNCDASRIRSFLISRLKHFVFIPRETRHDG